MSANVKLMITALLLLSGVHISGCLPPQATSGGNGVEIVAEPSEVTIPSGNIGTFQVSLSDDPGGIVVLDVSCIAGGCGFQPINVPELIFDSNNFSRPKTVFLTDTGFKGRGQSIFQITGGDLQPVFVLVIRD